MSLTLNLATLDLPANTEFPGNMSDLLTLIAEYLAIEGGDNFSGINFGDTEPAEADRDKPWFKTDNSGNPLGWYSWSGSAWTVNPLRVPRGATADRPVSPDEGMKYFDTSINVELIYERGAWRTAAGSPGDIKFVSADTIDAATTANPGWSQFTDASGRVIGAAGAGTDLTNRSFNDQVGEETHLLSEDEMPSHSHDISGLQSDRMSRNDLSLTAFVGPNSPAIGEGTVDKAVDSAGSDTAHNNMQPTIFMWCLKKD